jgi:hypothetical protein
MPPLGTRRPVRLLLTFRLRKRWQSAMMIRRHGRPKKVRRKLLRKYPLTT